ncbi:MAG: hypothetical protein EB163_09325 [Nitrososphaeria archaeon]|nr:hypothetical protein [Nitrososphaeria archaeon]NDF48365.1 hypothetical protein [Nitrosopumilaceae archaeon]
MAVSYQYSLGTTPVQVVPTDNVQRSVCIHSKGSIYLGNEGVTTANGLIMDNGDKIVIILHEGETLWAVSNTTAQSLSILITAIT